VKVFPKRKYIFFGTKIFLCRKHLQSESVFEMKVKLFVFEMFFVFFFKKMPETKIFLGGAYGQRAGPALASAGPD